MLDHVSDGDAAEIINLASRQYGGDYLVLFRGGQNKHHVFRRFFKRFQESIECRGGEHVHLVDYKHPVASVGRRHLHLVGQRPYIIHTIIGRGIKLDDVERTALVKVAARVAAIAGFAFGSAVGAIDCLGKNARARGLAHTTRAAEQIGMCKPVLRYRVFKRGG